MEEGWRRQEAQMDPGVKLPFAPVFGSVSLLGGSLGVNSRTRRAGPAARRCSRGQTQGPFCCCSSSAEKSG